MDMSNATVAGPSYGLLDLIFGSKPKAESDGKGFAPIMEMIAAMKKENDDSQASEQGRTEKDTALGKSTGDSRVVGMPGMPFLVSAEQMQVLLNQQAAEQASGKQMQSSQEAPAAKLLQANPMQSQAATDKLKEFQALSKMMHVVKESALSPAELASAMMLAKETAKEKQVAVMKHMQAQQEVVGMQELASMPHVMQSEDSIHQAALKEQIPEGALMKELAAKGAQGKILHEGAEVALQNGHELKDKLVSTDEFMKIREQQMRSQEALAGVAAEKRNLAMDKLNARKAETYSQTKVGSMNEIANLPEAVKAKEGSDPLLGDAKQNFRPENHSHAIGAEALVGDASKGVAGGVVVKNIFLPGGQKEMQSGLTNEVAKSVHFQAVKGGGEMKMIIHPEALGELTLKVGAKNGQVEVSIAAENEEVANMLRKSAGDLQSALGEQNLALAKFEVNVSDKQVNASSDSQKGSLDQQLQQQSQGGAFAQMNQRNGSNAWGGTEQGSRFMDMMGDGNIASAAKPAKVSQQQAVKKYASQRLDVVA